MIRYNPDLFWRTLFQLTGTVFPKVFFRSICMCIVGVAAATIEHYGYIDSESSYLDSDGMQEFYSFMGLVLGLLLSFRMNLAFNRWQEGISNVNQLTNRVRCIVEMLAAQLGGDDGNKGNKFKNDEEKKSAVCETLQSIRKKLIALLILILKDARDEKNVEDLKEANLISQFQYEALVNVASRKVGCANPDDLSFPVKARPSLVLQFIRYDLAKAWRKGLLATTFTNNMHQQLDSVSELYTGIAQISSTPMPFIYAHFIKAIVTFYVFAFPFGVANQLKWATPAAVFILAQVMFGVDAISTEIDNPFDDDLNDIDVQARILRIDRETACLLAYHHSRVKHDHASHDFLAAKVLHKEEIVKKSGLKVVKQRGSRNGEREHLLSSRSESDDDQYLESDA